MDYLVNSWTILGLAIAIGICLAVPLCEATPKNIMKKVIITSLNSETSNSFFMNFHACPNYQQRYNNLKPPKDGLPNQVKIENAKKSNKLQRPPITHRVKKTLK